MYCTECGNKIREDEMYCTECGTPRQAPTYSKMESIVKENPVAAKKINKLQMQKNKTKHTNTLKLYRIVSMILIVVMTITATLKLSFFNSDTKKGKSIKAESLVVTYAEPKASLVGIDVDVNSLNLTDKDKKLSVEKFKESIGEDGFLGIEYDISLAEDHYLRAPLTVTLPYDEISAKDKDVCILHFDSDYEEWIPQSVEVDPESKTVTANLTSLSPIRMVYFDKDYSDSVYYIENNGQKDATIKVRYNYWDYIKNTPMEPANIVAQDYILNGNTNSSTNNLINSIDGAINSTNTYYTLFGSLADVVYSTTNTLAASGGMLKNVTDKASKGVGILSLVIASSQLIFDLGTKESTGPNNETAVNLYKNIASNLGTLYSFCTGYSSAALSVGFFSVAITGYMLDSLVEEAKTIQADTVEAVFDSYYKEHSNFNEHDWYNIFVDSYWDAWQNNRESADGMEYAIKKVTDAIDNHAEKFWTEIYRGGSDALTFAVADAGKKNFYTPTADQKEELTSRFKEDMYQRFNKITMPWINSFMQERMKDAVLSSLMRTVKPYNRSHTVKIQEIAPDDGETVCKFQMCPIRFGSQDGFVVSEEPEEWNILAPKDDQEWAVEQDFTLLGYIMAGAPDKIFLFDPWDEKKDFGKHIRQDQLVILGEEEDYMTLIDLSLGDGNIAGIYDVTGSISYWDSTDPLTGFSVQVDLNGENMKITFLNDTNTILTGKYNEDTQTFVGIDLKPIDVSSLESALGSTFWQMANTKIVFDLSETIVKGELLKPKSSEEDQFLDFTVSIEFTMVKTGE